MQQQEINECAIAAMPTARPAADPKRKREVVALLKLSHSPAEHCLYQAMFDQTRGANTKIGAFSIRRLMSLTGLNGYSTIRRGRDGLIAKLSVDRLTVDVGDDDQPQRTNALYMVYSPDEIFARRQQAGIKEMPAEFKRQSDRPGFASAIESVAGRHDLSRREAQVALCCTEGLTNAEIGGKLFIAEQTVKFHLRNIYIKFGVKRRAQLISRLLSHEYSQSFNSLDDVIL
jgi:DNA-binding CsgD family transcriptional regulator